MKKNNKTSINSGGGPIFLGKVDNRGGTIRGRNDIHQSGLNVDEATLLFDNLLRSIDYHSRLTANDKADLKVEIEELRRELAKKNKADESFLLRRLRNIGRMAPDILQVALAVIANPAAGFGVIGIKIAEKIKASSG